MHVKLAAATIVASLAWTACSTAGTATGSPIALGAPFNLRPGEFAQTADAGLRIGFTGVAADSRCPKGEQCVVAGHAVVRVWLQLGAGPKEQRELHTGPGNGQALRLFNHELRLVALTPDPVTGKVVLPADQVATLTLTRSTTGANER